MFNKHRMIVVGNTASLFLLVSFVLCVAFGAVFPSVRMVEAWAPLLPGFEWLTLKGFLFGLVGSYLYGWYIAVLWVPLYAWFSRRDRITE